MKFLVWFTLVFLWCNVVSAHVSQEPGLTANKFDEAVSLGHHHDFDDAIKHLKDIVTSRPQHVGAWLHLASNQLVIGDIDAAKETCSLAARVAETVAVLGCFGRIAYAEGRLEAAAGLIQLVSGSSFEKRNDAIALWVTAVAGDLALATGDQITAETLYRRVLLQQENPRVATALADILLAQKRWQEVLQLSSAGQPTLSLELRLLIAQKKLGLYDQQAQRSKILDEEFRRDISLGDFRHSREFAKFYLDINANTKLACLAATENLKVQQEPEDKDLFQRACENPTGLKQDDP